MHVRCPHCSNPIELIQDQPEDVACPSCGSRFSLFDGLDETTDVSAHLQRIAHFELLERVGAGNFGAVWRARDTELNRIVAVKVPHRERLSTSDAELFYREARNAAQIKHNHAVTVHEVGRHEDLVYVVSEFIDGLPLNKWRPTYQPDARRVAELCATMADTLQAAHDIGIVHRDLKPGNVLMDAAGQPHLTDFGLAKREGVEATIAVSGQILGTPAYMSPEQASGESHLADARSDVFSLGVMMYEMLTNKRPFDGDRDVLLERIRNVEPIPPRKHDAKIPRDLETICLKSLEKVPVRRYQSAGEVADDLRRFLEGEPIRARRISWAERTVRWVRRRPAQAIALVLLVLLLAIIPLAVRALQPSGPPENARQISIATEPPGGRLLFIPMSTQTGQPLADQAHAFPPASKDIWLVPGDYLVVAYLSDDQFHEVYRRVPETEDELPRLQPHQYWKFTDDGKVELPTIRLFSQNALESAMVAVTQGTLRVRELGHGERNSLMHLPSFLVDPTELSYGEARVSGLPIPRRARDAPSTDDAMPMTNLSWDESVGLAEKMGKRLLLETEYEYLSTAAGTRPYPWGENPPPDDNWQLRSVHEPTSDTLKWNRLDRPIHGLFSNALEWMDGRADPSSRPFRGGPTQSDQGANATPWDRNGLMPAATKLNLGVRFGRSRKPRLSASDFPQLAYEARSPNGAILYQPRVERQ